MGRFVSISKAATLVGISTKELQLEMEQGQLQSVRGMVHLDDLTQLHPEVRVDEVDMVEWVNKIKDNSLLSATEKLSHELSKHELQQLLLKLNAEHAYQRDKIEAYENLIQELRYSLQVLQKKSSEPNKIQSLISWIDNKLNH